MALLKKIKAATLMETMVATVLIVVIFMISSLLLNTIFNVSIQGNTQLINEKLNKLEYQYKQGIINASYYEDWENWEIDIEKQNKRDNAYIVFRASQEKSGKTVMKYLSNED